MLPKTRNLPISLVQSCLFPTAGSVPGLWAEQSHGASKGKHPCSETTVFPSTGAASQAACHPAMVKPHPPQTSLASVTFTWSQAPHILTYHPLCHFYSYGQVFSSTWEHLGLHCICKVDLHSNDREVFKWWLKPAEILKCT